MRLGFDVASCVYASSKLASCTKCIDVCPTQTLQFANNLPAFVPSDCIDCGGCVGACPTEAFSLADFSPTSFVFDFLKQEHELISCTTNVPCLAVLNVEYLISLGLQKKIHLDMGQCQTCDIAKTLLPSIEKRVEEANYILESFGFEPLVSLETPLTSAELPTQSSRRDFLRNFSLEGLGKQQKVFEDALSGLKSFCIDTPTIAKLKQKTPPNHRKLLLVSLSQHDLSNHYETLDGDEVDCYSQKYITESCTNCQMCYRLCPTSALSSDTKQGMIAFDASLCVKCHLCHDVCEPNAILIQKGVETEVLVSPQKRILAQFNPRRCDECGVFFSTPDDTSICPRCQIEEEEAFVLQNRPKQGE